MQQFGISDFGQLDTVPSSLRAAVAITILTCVSFGIRFIGMHIGGMNW